MSVHLFSAPVTKDAHTDAWALLWRALAALGFDGHAYTLRRTERGKPYFAEAGAPAFSLAHTKTLAVCAIDTAGNSVGVDAERTERGISDAVAARFLARFPAKTRVASWTMRESFGKCTGEGAAAQTISPDEYCFDTRTAAGHTITICTQKQINVLHKRSNKMYYLGIDLGGTNIAVGIVDENLNLVRKGKVKTGVARGNEAVMRDMGELCARLLAEENIPLSEVAWAGIATPGIADSARGEVVYSCNLDFHNFPIAKTLQKYLPVEKVFVANDANAAALGEAKCGAAKGYDNVVMVTLGTGVGGGIVQDGKILEGFNGAAGELGHMVIVANGQPCGCTRKGCFEAYSSATALVRMTREKMEKCPDSAMWKIAATLEDVDGRTAFDASRAGDAAAKEVVDDYIYYLGCGLTNLINIFQPQILCIGGGICGEGEYLLAPLRAIIEREEYSRDMPKENRCELRVASLGNDAGILGAAVLGL